MASPQAGICKICGGSKLAPYRHTAKCGSCGVLLYYPYPVSSEPSFTDESEKLHWYGRSAFYNHVNFTRMLRFSAAGESPKRALSVLDYGGGGGQFALVVRSHFPRASVYLVDMNDESALPEWAAFSHRIRFADFPRDDTRFDLIFLNDVFEHLDDPLGLLVALAGKLAPGGRIFIDTPRQFWLYPVTRLASASLYSKVLRGTVSTAHLQVWSDRALRITVAAADLEVVRFAKWAEFTMPYDFYLDNMGITSPALRAAGKLMYDASGLVLRNKIACLLRRPAASRTG